MKAVGFYKNLPIEDKESLLDITIEKPVAKGKDILVKVEAIGVNPADYYGRLHAPVDGTAKITGFDASGIVEAVGSDVELFKSGDKVYYSGDATKPGCNSEYHLVDERIVGFKPETLDYPEAAGIPLTGLAAYEGLFDRLRISRDPVENKGKSILVIGAAGGVGSITVQLAKKAGLTVIGTASRPETVDWVTSLGADYTINHYAKFLPQLTEKGLGLVDYIICANSTDKHWENMAEAIKPQGAICGIAALEGPVDLSLIGIKSVSFSWEVMFTRSMFQTEDMIEQHHALNDMAKMIDAGELKTTVNEILRPINAANLKKAHAAMESGKAIGKIVLTDFQ